LFFSFYFELFLQKKCEEIDETFQIDFFLFKCYS